MDESRDWAWRQDVNLKRPVNDEDPPEVSFLDSPDALWQEPQVEEVLTCIGNARSFYFYGAGFTSKNQDLSSYMTQEELQADLKAYGNPPGSDEILQRPFACVVEALCRCGVGATRNMERLYNELPSQNHIRLLEVLPGSGPVQCSMHVALLPDDKHTYEALSYTWDLNYYEYSDEKERFPIICSGFEVSIKENLYTALCRVREQDVSRLLWVDALCINQEDLLERSYQVQRMDVIYENAFRVVIWFGKVHHEPKKPAKPAAWTPPASVPTTLAQEAFSGICEIVNEWRAKANLADTIACAGYTTHANKTQVEPNGEVLSAGNPLWRKVFCLYSARWFKRLWVVQEAALARSAVVIWDDSEISWEWIRLAAAIIRSNFQRISNSIRKDSSRNPFRPPTRRVPMVSLMHTLYIDSPNPNATSSHFNSPSSSC